eukprot:TRINITY_DN8394_c0_g1_i2.p1 TRINITY_DN8394_c0_g1~~TRINITY_DN8394_c0_g1_i2.p1  ORF type:complete len:214 (+),score=28.86 TRINITY_DN8394_c0_g1_i2:63-644(+)
MSAGASGHRLPCVQQDVSSLQAQSASSLAPYSTTTQAAWQHPVAYSAHSDGREAVQTQPLASTQVLLQQKPKLPWHEVRDLIREEIASTECVQGPGAQPVQFVISNQAKSSTLQQESTASAREPNFDGDPLRKPVANWLASPMNRLCAFSVVALGMYMLHGHLEHKWRMAEYKRRRDVNLFLRFVQEMGLLHP